MNNEIELLYRNIALAIYAVKPSIEWVKGHFHFEGITLMNKGICTYFLPDGSPKNANAGFDINDDFLKLRAAMAKLHENNNAWFTAVCDVTPDGKYSFHFDYDHLPAFDIVPGPNKWLDEFKNYPRPELQAQIQDWIDGKAEHADIVKRLGELQKK